MPSLFQKLNKMIHTVQNIYRIKLTKDDKTETVDSKFWTEI